MFCAREQSGEPFSTPAFGIGCKGASRFRVFFLTTKVPSGFPFTDSALLRTNPRQKSAANKRHGAAENVNFLAGRNFPSPMQAETGERFALRGNGGMPTLFCRAKKATKNSEECTPKIWRQTPFAVLVHEGGGYCCGGGGCCHFLGRPNIFHFRIFASLRHWLIFLRR